MSEKPWWRSALIHQIYPRSFAESNGDGIGDLRGIIDHLDHLAWLGVDGIWLSPIPVSPNADWGYDVADFCDVDPDYGTLGHFDTLISECDARGTIRIATDRAARAKQLTVHSPWALGKASSWPTHSSTPSGNLLPAAAAAAPNSRSRSSSSGVDRRLFAQRSTLLRKALWRASSSSPLIGLPAPPLSGDTVTGGPISLGQFRGRWVVLNFFATWCVPCQTETPELLRFAGAHRGLADATILGVVFQDDDASVRAFIAERKVTWPMLAYSTTQPIDAYGVGGIPVTFLISPDGRVAAKALGGLRTGQLDALLDAAKGHTTGASTTSMRGPNQHPQTQATTMAP